MNKQRKTISCFLSILTLSAFSLSAIRFFVKKATSTQNIQIQNVTKESIINYQDFFTNQYSKYIPSTIIDFSLQFHSKTTLLNGYLNILCNEKGTDKYAVVQLNKSLSDNASSLVKLSDARITDYALSASYNSQSVIELFNHVKFDSPSSRVDFEFVKTAKNTIDLSDSRNYLLVEGDLVLINTLNSGSYITIKKTTDDSKQTERYYKKI